MQRNVWTVEVQWTSACATGGCVSVGWRKACSSATNCVEVDHREDRVLMRDGKLGDESPVITLSVEEFKAFTTAAMTWDRQAVLHCGAVAVLLRPARMAPTYDVCVHQQPLDLYFTWQEWDEFVEGVKAGKFSIEERPSG